MSSHNLPVPVKIAFVIGGLLLLRYLTVFVLPESFTWPVYIFFWVWMYFFWTGSGRMLTSEEINSASSVSIREVDVPTVEQPLSSSPEIVKSVDLESVTEVPQEWYDKYRLERIKWGRESAPNLLKEWGKNSGRQWPNDAFDAVDMIAKFADGLFQFEDQDSSRFNSPAPYGSAIARHISNELMMNISIWSHEHGAYTKLHESALVVAALPQANIDKNQWLTNQVAAQQFILVLQRAPGWGI